METALRVRARSPWALAVLLLVSASAASAQTAGTTVSGTPTASGASNDYCMDWTSGGGDARQGGGDVSFMDGRWTDSVGDGCANAFHRYRFEQAHCGDGIRDADEECDDANGTHGDGCTGCITDWYGQLKWPVEMGLRVREVPEGYGPCFRS